MKNFEDYLKEKHYEENPQVLDDDLPDSYDSWLTDLPVDDLIKHADEYTQLKLDQQKEELEDVVEGGMPNCRHDDSENCSCEDVDGVLGDILSELRKS